MALPLVNLPNVSLTEYGPTTPLGFKPVWKNVSRTGRTRQARPYNLATSANTAILCVNSAQNLGNKYTQTGDLWGSTQQLNQETSSINEAYNSAWGRFKSAMQNATATNRSGDNASLGETFAEGHQAISMIVKRVSTLRLFARHLRRLELGRAYQDLIEAGVPRERVMMHGRLRRGAKAFGDNFLEFHFGWEPLLSDIHGACNVIMSGIPPTTLIKASGKSTRTLSSKLGTGGLYGYWGGVSTTRVRLSAAVQVSNPNLWLLNQLGLLNPVTIAWNLVPFSFLVDWFVNVSSVLDGYSDLVGLSLSRQSRLDFRRVSESYSYNDSTVNGKVNPNPTIKSFSGTCTFMKRGTSIGSGPVLRFNNALLNLSPTRGVTAIALLVQQLRP